MPTNHNPSVVWNGKSQSQMNICLQNNAPLEEGDYCRTRHLTSFMCFQIMCINDADGGQRKRGQAT